MVAERRIDAALTYLERLPVPCVACSLLAMAYFAAQLTFGTPWSRLPVTSFIMLYWLLILIRYARESAWDRGRLPILIAFHLIGFLGVGFIATRMTGLSGKVIKFYDGRGTQEQWIREGKYAVKRTRLSCRNFNDNQTRLQLFALVYNLGNPDVRRD